MNNMHNIEMERALLGLCLVDGDLVKVLDIEPKDFYVETHQWIYKSMLNLGVIDIITVADELERIGKLSEIGGTPKLMKFSSSFYSLGSAEEYAETIKGYRRARTDVQVLTKALNEINNGGLNRAQLLSDLTSNTGVVGQAVHIKEHASVLFDDIEKRQNDPREIWGMPTGFSDLDKLTGGVHKKQTTIFAGAPAVGKTMLVMQIAYQMAVAGHSVGVWSFEMNASRLLGRLVSAVTGVPTRKMYQGKLNGDLSKVMTAIGNLENLPIYISDVSGMTTSTLRADVHRIKVLHGIDVAVLDYINLLLDSDGANRNENTANKARRWQAICKDMDIHGLTVQSMNKEGMRAAVPDMAGMSGPADVSFDADNIFFMVKPPTDVTPVEDSGEVIKLLPSKLRDGDMGKKPIDLVKLKGLPKFGIGIKYKADVSNV